MRHTQRHISAVVVAAAAVVFAGGGACPVGPIDFCEQSVRSQCEFEFRCCKDKERIQSFSSDDYVTSEGECFDRKKGICKAFLAPIEDSISLGRAKFNGDKASECLSALNKARDTCIASDGFSTACDEIISGLVDDGDDCAADFECGDGGQCEIDAVDPDLDEDNGNRQGSCKLPGEKGDDCTPLCARGLVCDVTAGGDGTCVTAPEKGDDCIAGNCGGGLFCNADTQCEELRDDGDDCDANFECKTDICTDGECGTGTCDGR